jgi:hypothetical protein
VDPDADNFMVDCCHVPVCNPRQKGLLRNAIDSGIARGDLKSVSMR